jgi:hypothetical protein
MDAQSIANLTRALAPRTAEAEFGGGLWPQHVGIVNAFMAVAMQWRVVSRGGGGAAGPFGGMVAPIVPFFIGLDYSAVRAGLEAEGFIITPELWRCLRVMEDEACTVLNRNS